jgi:hypothetical protein
MATDPQLAAILLSLNKVAERAISKITLDITANLIESTPVKTGWARANWIPSVTKAVQDTDGTQEQAEAGSISSGKQTSGTAEAATYKLPQGQVFIANNVPYILRLNDGSSSLAPAGFVEAAIQKAVLEDILGAAT